MLASRSLPYVLPFAIFLTLLAIIPLVQLGPRSEQIVWLLVVGGVLLTFSRQAIDLSVRRWIPSVGVGVAVFVIWITPDLLAPGYRDSLLFRNALVGEVASAFPVEARSDSLAIAMRAARAAILVPIVEELFWRAWLPRWIAHADFQQVPLGTYTPAGFAITAVLFATEHGPYWDVGLLAGVAYNLWMWRTKSLGDCILAHAMTNACLAAYVVTGGQWQYW